MNPVEWNFANKRIYIGRNGEVHVGAYEMNKLFYGDDKMSDKQSIIITKMKNGFLVSENKYNDPDNADNSVFECFGAMVYGIRNIFNIEDDTPMTASEVMRHSKSIRPGIFKAINPQDDYETTRDQLGEARQQLAKTLEDNSRLIRVNAALVDENNCMKENKKTLSKLLEETEKKLVKLMSKKKPKSRKR